MTERTGYDDPADVLSCESCDFEKGVRYYVRMDHEEPCPECGGAVSVERIGHCDRCGEPFTPDDPMYVAVGAEDGFWFAERDPTEIRPGMVRVHEGCTEGYAEWAEEQG